MEIWAKLFESNGRQVLITKECDAEDNPKLTIATRIDGSEILSELLFRGKNTEGRLNWIFDKANQETADNFTNGLIGCETVEDAVSRLTASAKEYIE